MANLADKTVYWDACSWLGLINQEADKYPGCKYTIDEAEQRRVEIWTSAFTLAEVFKRKCAGTMNALDVSKDQVFEDFLLRDFIVLVEVDRDIGTLARALLRRFSIKQPQDAIHIATAVWHNLDELHSFDEKIISLNDSIPKRDETMLLIKKPDIMPPPGPLFTGSP